MKNYILSENEVVLFRGMVALHYEWKELARVAEYNTELLLTNEKLVFMPEADSSLSEANPQILAVEEIKVYDNKIQVIRKKNTIEIYHKSGELYLQFELEKTAKEFCEKTLKLHSGYTKFVRTVKTAEKVIKDNTEPLGIDAKKLAKDTAKVAFAAITARTSNSSKGVGATMKAVANMLQSNQKKNGEEQLLLADETTKSNN